MGQIGGPQCLVFGIQAEGYQVRVKPSLDEVTIDLFLRVADGSELKTRLCPIDDNDDTEITSHELSGCQGERKHDILTADSPRAVIIPDL